MPIGSYYHYNADNHSGLKRLVRKLYFIAYGTPDLHTHIRWRAIKGFIKLNDIKTVIDIGCGSGTFTFELALKNNALEIVGIDISKNAIDLANFIKERVKTNNVNFCYLDATKSYPYPDNHFDLVLLIDIIEHVQDDESIIREASRVLKPKGYMIISVPTPNYPLFFGRNFHEEIGHVRNGYWLDDLAKLLGKHNLNIVNYRYYTYLPSSIVCALFYRYLRKVKYIGFFASPVLNVLSFLDAVWPIRSRNFASSLVVKAQKGG